MEQLGRESQSSTILVSDPKPVKLIYEAGILPGFTGIEGDFEFRISL